MLKHSANSNKSNEFNQYDYVHYMGENLSTIRLKFKSKIAKNLESDQSSAVHIDKEAIKDFD